MAGRTKITMQVEGLDELYDNLTNVAPSQARSILRQAVHGLAAEVRDELKRVVKKDSGQLAKSIKAYRLRGDGPDKPVSEVRGGSTAPYMLMLEFGTSKTKAQPFITPTAERFRPQLSEHYRKEFAEKFAKSIARAAKKAKKG